MDGALEIAAAVRRGDTTATETVSRYLNKASESTLNAFTLIDADGAQQSAGQIDSQIRRGEDPGPLAGVPIAVKDLIDQAGLPNTAGSSFYRRIPEVTATSVRRLQAAGAIPIGRTGLHEFAFGFSSENHWFGPVLNPWDQRTSPGGSSGGSGAAVAAGLAVAALGTDTGGSVRVPAALCGVVGLKVTHGRIPISGVFPLAPSLDTIGPIARSVRDASLLYTLMAGGDVFDPWSSFSPVKKIGSLSEADEIRIGIPRAWIETSPMTTEVAVAFDSTCGHLRDVGATLVDVEIGEIAAPALLTASAYGEVAAVHRSLRTPDNVYGPEVEARMRAAEAVTLDEYFDGLIWRARLRQSFERAFDLVDFIVTPATGATRKIIGHDTIETSSGEVNYRDVLSRFSAPINHAGLPGLVVPLTDAGSPPPALQIVAPWWREDRLLALGAFLENSGLCRVESPQTRDNNRSNPAAG